MEQECNIFRSVDPNDPPAILSAPLRNYATRVREIIERSERDEAATEQRDRDRIDRLRGRIMKAYIAGETVRGIAHGVGIAATTLRRFVRREATKEDEVARRRAVNLRGYYRNLERKKENGTHSSQRK